MKLPLALFAVLALAACTNPREELAKETPKDIRPESLSRMPLANREAMDEYGQAVFDRVSGKDRPEPLLGPGGLSLHMPKVADGMDLINQYLRYNSVLGRRNTETAILVAAREMDQAYEWAAHEVAAKREGVPQEAIDVIASDKDIVGLPEAETVIIRYGRQLFRYHDLDSQTWSDAVRLFGEQGALEISAVMGDYAMAGMMLNAVNHQIPADRKDTMPRRR